MKFQPDPNTITPGLLQVLRTLVALRTTLLLVGSGLVVVVMRVIFDAQTIDGAIPPIGARFVAMLFILESVLLFVIVFWPGLQRRLGPWFLPITLGWLLLSPYIQQLVAILAIPADFMGRGERTLSMALASSRFGYWYQSCWPPGSTAAGAGGFH